MPWLSPLRAVLLFLSLTPLELPPPVTSQEKLKALVQAHDSQHKAKGAQKAVAERAEREKLRIHRRTSVIAASAAAIKPRATEPFKSPIPPMPGSEQAAAAAATPAAKGGAKGKGGSAAKPGKGGKSSLGAPPANPGKKSSTKMLALQHNRPGEKPKGLKKWTIELDARGWSKKKTALSAGLEAWFEAYADAYSGIRLQKMIAPWAFKRNHELMRDACYAWWLHAKALREHTAAKGQISSGAAGKIVFLGAAAMLLRRWRKRAAFKKALPSHLRTMPYGRLLRKAIGEWRTNLEDSTARRKEGIRKLVAVGAAHYATRIALPNAWLCWCVSPATRLPTAPPPPTFPFRAAGRYPPATS